MQTSRRMADYFIGHLPADGFVPWYARSSSRYLVACADAPRVHYRDFNAPLDPPRPADSSAAMIAAAGLQILAATEKSLSNTTGADRWNAGAQMVMLSRQLDVFLTNVVAHYADRKLRMESQLAESAEQWCAINFIPYDGS